MSKRLTPDLFEEFVAEVKGEVEAEGIPYRDAYWDGALDFYNFMVMEMA